MNYIDFIEVPNPKHKTKIWHVRNIQTQVFLGYVHWRTGFRKYVFSPDISPLDFDDNCLEKITEFLKFRTERHYAELNNI